MIFPVHIWEVEISHKAEEGIEKFQIRIAELWKDMYSTFLVFYLFVTIDYIFRHCLFS